MRIRPLPDLRRELPGAATLPGCPTPDTLTPLRRAITPADPTHFATFAGAARVLLENVPADERGPRLRKDAREIAAALDRRNGNAVQSELLRERFFPQG